MIRRAEPAGNRYSWQLGVLEQVGTENGIRKAELNMDSDTAEGQQ